MVKDGHIHTPYCPHGSADTLKHYIEQAIRLGYRQMTFTEHAPLPPSFTDPTGDSAMAGRHLEKYFADITRVKEAYKNELTIWTGLEVDYIAGFEEETKALLNCCGPLLDDAILSVHFLKPSPEQYICMDASPDAFEQVIAATGSLEAVYSLYYQTVLASIAADLGPYKPKRIGHISLVRKFQTLFPRSFDDEALLYRVLERMKQHGYALDVNGAGLAKPYCNEFYPPLHIAKQAGEMGIPLFYGSDAHSASDLGRGLEDFLRLEE
ncbi:histidinol-phosphatase (PHP family) [Evansella caseinilytica]|uniref:Histidinol-phosphatase n=1 Tax=Evansella caseinilytica TaxID=1503961 RepID=A0A1H3RRS3_9BACI|nr:histidinol-phosphatase HisJ [Evansella caseinilytica]SDZ28397.1 histidinol-phosphatase (PHP family) [Evansella caseinilytica]